MERKRDATTVAEGQPFRLAEFHFRSIVVRVPRTISPYIIMREYPPPRFHMTPSYENAMLPGEPNTLPARNIPSCATRVVRIYREYKLHAMSVYIRYSTLFRPNQSVYFTDVEYRKIQIYNENKGNTRTGAEHARASLERNSLRIVTVSFVVTIYSRTDYIVMRFI